MERFSRLSQLLGNEKLEALSKKRITVLGLGAVGAMAAEALARCGIGNITLVDFDKIAVSNINRHWAAFQSTVGESKIKVMGERIRDINYACTVNEIEIFACCDTFDEIFKEKPHVVIDAIDSLGPKIELLAYCKENNLPVVSSMGAALRKDPACIKIADLFETEICPLARNLRKHLRRRGIEKGITCVYSDENPVNEGLRPPPSIEENQEESDAFVRGRSRNILGSYPIVTAAFGLHIAHAVMEKLEVFENNV